MSHPGRLLAGRYVSGADGILPAIQRTDGDSRRTVRLPDVRQRGKSYGTESRHRLPPICESAERSAHSSSSHASVMPDTSETFSRIGNVGTSPAKSNFSVTRDPAAARSGTTSPPRHVTSTEPPCSGFAATAGQVSGSTDGHGGASRAFRVFSSIFSAATFSAATDLAQARLRNAISEISIMPPGASVMSMRIVSRIPILRQSSGSTAISGRASRTCQAPSVSIGGNSHLRAATYGEPLGA